MYIEREYCFRPINNDDTIGPTDTAMPVLAPPPKSPVQNIFNDSSPRFNPFDQQTEFVSTTEVQMGVASSDKGNQSAQ